MEVWAKKIPWGFVLLLAGALGQTVNYPGPICAVKGSTVTIPCSFTPKKDFVQQNRRVLLRIVRVVWCQNHLLCHGTTPSVYDSNSPNNNPRYRYLGDFSRNCTLQIMNIQLRDSASHRFRMEADNSRGHFVGMRGVNVTVIDGFPMRISSSSSERVVRAGGRVTLSCTAFCSFHQLDVTWYRNGHALSETGPALQLNPLRADDSGNYSCALKTNEKTRSEPYSLCVEKDGAQMRISSSSSERVVRAGGRVTLSCTAFCSFHQLDVTWYRNGHALSETGPALQLNCLTADDSGDYSCALKTGEKTRSDPYSLCVEADGETTYNLLLIGRFVVFLLAAIALTSAVFVIIKRMKIK